MSVSSRLSGVGTLPFEVGTEATVEKRDSCAKLRKDEIKCLQMIEEEVFKMMESCDIQKNVNKMVMDHRCCT